MTESTPPAKPSGIRLVRCPACDREVEWRPENRYRPFCSARCKGIDLGAWANEQYRVPGAPVPTAPDQDD